MAARCWWPTCSTAAGSSPACSSRFWCALAHHPRVVRRAGPPRLAQQAARASRMVSPSCRPPRGRSALAASVSCLPRRRLPPGPVPCHPRARAFLERAHAQPRLAAGRFGLRRYPAQCRAHRRQPAQDVRRSERTGPASTGATTSLGSRCSCSRRCGRPRPLAYAFAGARRLLRSFRKLPVGTDGERWRSRSLRPRALRRAGVLRPS